MAVDLAKALFQSRTRAALLRAVLRDGVSDSLSGLARRTGLSQHSVAVEVKNLARAGLVTVESIGNADVVRANDGHSAVGLLVQLLAVADRAPANVDDSALKESLAYFGAPVAGKRRAHLSLEVTLARGLSAAKRDPAVLKALPVVLLKNRAKVDWSALKEEVRKLKLKRELGKIVELAAAVSGRAELKVHVADLKDSRQKTDPFCIDGPVRSAVMASLRRSGGPSFAAADAAAAERDRLRRMSATDRALLALDLGERLSALRGRDA